jgi:hypothetical protein
LIVKNSYIRSYGVFKVHASRARPTRLQTAQSLKTQQRNARDVEVDVDLGESGTRTETVSKTTITIDEPNGHQR